MANQPHFHDFQDELGGHNRVSNYNELLKRAQQKKADYERTKVWVSEQGSIDDFVSIKPSKELALVEYYSSMSDVEIAPEVKEFWTTQQQGLANIDIKGPQTKYLNAYEQWQKLVEDMDDDKRSQYGVNNFHKEEADAKHNIKEAQRRVREANKRIRDTEDEVNPFAAIIGAATGMNHDFRKLVEARHAKKEAKRGVKEAKLRLQAVRERKALLQERLSKQKVKEYMLLDTMNDALGEMAINQEAAAKIDENSKKYAQSLHKQYETIDKFKSIQKLKQGNLNDPSKRTLLKDNNKELFDSLEALPDSLPKNSFKVSLEGPLTLPDNSNRLSEIDEKIAEIQTHLPAGIDLEDLPNEIAKYKLKETDTKDTIEAEKATLDPNSQEYKRLEMKQKHLELQEKVETCKKNIETLKQEMVNADTDNKRQAILKKLSKEKQIFDILKTELDKDPYSQTINGLEEIQKLQSERTSINSQSNMNIQNLDDISTQLESSNFSIDRRTPLATTYSLIVQAIERSKQENLKKLEKNHQKLPLEKEDDEPEQPNQGDGRQ